MTDAYAIGLDKNGANYAQLTPLDFYERAAEVYPERLAVVHGARRFTWKQLRDRGHRLASALAKRGIGRDDTVAALLLNTPEMVECFFGVPLAGAVLNTLNTRLDTDTIAYILEHGEAKALLVDRELSGQAREAVAKLARKPLVIDVDDPEYDGPGERIGEMDYEAFLATGNPDQAFPGPRDEWDAIALNYTSGTTGRPKGVVYHHRGAYLNALSNALDWDMPRHPVYLWTLPMFHASGWCFPWTIAARVGVNVCLRKVDVKKIFELIKSEHVTHYCGAPVVQSMIINAPAALKAGIEHTVNGSVAGAPPPMAVIEGLEAMGFTITHVYGLTETYGPAGLCVKHADWAGKSAGERGRLNARQGVRYLAQAAMTVLDPESMKPVPADGETMGEVMFRGNITMKGYLKNGKATEEAFAGGWFHSGDLGVLESDGYVKIKDRSKDIIISGGENVSSVEVEDVLYRHPAVLAAAVVAKPDDKWGEVPAAFIELREGAAQPSVDELRAHCRKQLPGFAVPKVFSFGPLPRTSTGKIQKFVLRKQLDSASAINT
ncbi:MAG: acyl-CoA synthetase [Burkholderiaceae bacterium]|nr:MAG: acyl-CoA synthetase [Burkholderiaceae bacterium]